MLGLEKILNFMMILDRSHPVSLLVALMKEFGGPLSKLQNHTNIIYKKLIT